jgi:L-aspartate oxidase
MNVPQVFDHIVIGSGLAGLTFALKSSGTVCILTKGEITDSNTNWAQGGIAAAVGEADDWVLHERDTLIAGAGLCDVEAVRFLVQNAPSAIEWLRSLGARFDLDKGELVLGREGGHSRNRIVHHADRTGWEIERAVSAAVGIQKRITVVPFAFVRRLIVEDGRCSGVLAQVNGLGERIYRAKDVILASGGAGKMYQHTTNPRVATADGLALADQVGASIANLEFMQFHPTTLFHPQHRSFLITEAVRGAGGTLRNHLGRRFMYDYDERLELAPRDVVARAIEAEMARHSTWCVYLDTTHMDREQLIHEFPTVYEQLASIDLYMEKDWIPVVPAQHYSCGGVVTDLFGRTSFPGLFAAGEVACTGVHGANRLASNSLLEAIVFATAAATTVDDRTGTNMDQPCLPQAIPETAAIRIRRALQKTMTSHLGIVRTNQGMQTALTTINGLMEEYQACPAAPFSAYSLEAWNLLVAARKVVIGAMDRKTNVGLHFNADLKSQEQAGSLIPS